MTTIEIVGVYRIKPSMESILEAVRFHNYGFLLKEDGTYSDEIYWENFENLALIELQVSGEFTTSLLESISHGDQPEEDRQVPYMEFYLDRTGTRLISDNDAVTTSERHICFFLHFIDTNKPLNIGSDRMNLPAITDLPGRLIPLTHYLPVD
jgi:hypothetical protein